jgi:hypothetical protein
MQMAMNIVEIRIMLRGRPSRPLVLAGQRFAQVCQRSPKRYKLSINVDSND